MRTTGVVRSFLASGVLAMSAAVGYAADTPSSATPGTTVGNYFLNFDVMGSTPVPSGTGLTCRARVTPIPLSGNGSSLPGGGEGQGTSNGLKARCALQIPFFEGLDQARQRAVLSYEVVAVSSTGATVWSIADQGIVVAYPPAGTMVRIDFALRSGAR